MEKIIHCENCIYWRDWHVLLKDDTRRAYFPEEINERGFGSVPTSIGVNVAPQCVRDQLFAAEEGVHIPALFRSANDFCSKAKFGKPQFRIEND